jgi:hypothetical protein
MDSTLNRPLSKKIVRDSRFYYCIRITYQGEHYRHVWFWEGSTPLGIAATQSFAIFQKMLDMYHFGRSYLEIHLADLGESMLVGKVK